MNIEKQIEKIEDIIVRLIEINHDISIIIGDTKDYKVANIMSSATNCIDVALEKLNLGIQNGKF